MFTMSVEGVYYGCHDANDVHVFHGFITINICHGFITIITFHELLQDDCHGF